jgi:FkbM family methyltransferase
MPKLIKSMIQNSLRLFGVQLQRIPSAQKQQQQWLIDMQIKTVLDIGANTGQFAQDICTIFPDAMIYSFEPLPDCYEELVRLFADKSQFKAFNVALGNETGMIKMNRNEFSLSSSLLPLAELHKQNFPFAQKELVQEVKIARLDDFADMLNLREPILIKLDVQGFEGSVIDGGIGVIKQATIILIELSIEELYQGQLLFDDIYQKLKALGFQYRGNYAQAYSPLDGRILYVDGIFTK